MNSKERYNVIGLMSGTSLDGLDIAFCKFRKTKGGWIHAIEKTRTIKYTKAWLDKLSRAHTLSGADLMALDAAYGELLGTVCAEFIAENNLSVDFIASHGHTIFHQPEHKFTFQLGNGHAIYAVSKIPVVYDFRTLDVALGGQGAPLVPIGDKLLFSTYDVCLNLGGIANLSADVKGKRTAYDICFMNMGLNYLAGKAGKSFDRNGNWAREGSIDTTLARKLSGVYEGLRTSRPSLGREMFEKRILPLLDNKKIPLKDRLCTFTESSAHEVASAILSLKNRPDVLCTGGGSFNSFFISRLLHICGDNAELIIPDEAVVKFKEALVFAFLGLLRVRGEVNSLRSVTGASRSSSSGLLIGF